MERFTFAALRTRSIEALGDPTEIACTWQTSDSTREHVAVYCNLNSTMQAIGDLLRGGDWCDDISFMPPEDGGIVSDACYRVDCDYTQGDTDDERVFRFTGTLALLVEQAVADCRDIAKPIGRSRAPIALHEGNLMAYINQVWKHRGKSPSKMHIEHHHGPHLYFDSTIPDSKIDDGVLKVPMISVLITEIMQILRTLDRELTEQDLGMIEFHFAGDRPSENETSEPVPDQVLSALHRNSQSF